MTKSFGTFAVFCLSLILQAGLVSCSDPEIKLRRSKLREKLKVENELGEPRTRFTGIFREEFTASVALVDGNETAEELSRDLSYETAWPRNGRRKATIVKVSNHENARKKKRERFPLHNSKDVPAFLKRHMYQRRNRREIFGRDNRFYIPSRSFAQRFPFASVVKISTGCTGALVSPRHAITAAHCVHSGKDYVDGFRSLRVGLLQRDGTFNWIAVSHAKLPLAWVNGNDKTASKYDYVILKLSRKHKRPFLPITISDGERHGRGDRIHFTAFEDDKPRNTLWYRFCRVEEDGAHMLYHFCDAKPGSSGAGVYVYHYDTHSRAWGRRLVAVFSGNRWVTYPSWWHMAPRNYNAATRITTLKFAQICKWIGLKHWPRECNDYVTPEPTTDPSQTPKVETATTTATQTSNGTTSQATHSTTAQPPLTTKTTTNSGTATAPIKTTRTSVLRLIVKPSVKLTPKRRTETAKNVISPTMVDSPSTIPTTPSSAKRKNRKHRRKGHRRNKVRKEHKKTGEPITTVVQKPVIRSCNETAPTPRPTGKSQVYTTVQTTPQGEDSAIKQAMSQGVGNAKALAKARRERKHKRNKQRQGHKRNKMRKHRKLTQQINTTTDKKLGQISPSVKPDRVIEPTPTKPAMKGRSMRR